jgi:hypothetical protein
VSDGVRPRRQGPRNCLPPGRAVNGSVAKRVMLGPSTICHTCGPSTAWLACRAGPARAR